MLQNMLETLGKGHQGTQGCFPGREGGMVPKHNSPSYPRPAQEQRGPQEEVQVPPVLPLPVAEGEGQGP